MGYVAVRGGGAAIEESLKLLEYERLEHTTPYEIDDIAGLFPELIDQVMGEASLYAPQLAALALKQAQGSPDEAVFLLRAYRSTLERPYISRPLNTADMHADRRISAAFKDVPGGQILGATRDYSHRLLSFDLENETQEVIAEKIAQLRQHFELTEDESGESKGEEIGKLAAGGPCLQTENEKAEGESDLTALPRVIDYLREEGLIGSSGMNGLAAETDDVDPVDATMVPLSFPAPRSLRLQVLARGMTQAVEALGYAAIRGFGPAHPTVGELRRGWVPVLIDAPDESEPTQASSADDDGYYLGAISLTEVESVFMAEEGSGESEASQAMEFALGYGLVMGRGETKAIAMSVLDRCLEVGDKRFPTEDEEFVLYHVDGVEATGFISHLKLPHYVTFQSKLSSIRGTREEADDAREI